MCYLRSPSAVWKQTKYKCVICWPLVQSACKSNEKCIICWSLMQSAIKPNIKICHLLATWAMCKQTNKKNMSLLTCCFFKYSLSSNITAPWLAVNCSDSAPEAWHEMGNTWIFCNNWKFGREERQGKTKKKLYRTIYLHDMEEYLCQNWLVLHGIEGCGQTWL